MWMGLTDGVQSDDKTPIVMVIPGLTSDSHSAYVKHLAFKMAKSGWNVVVSNHRGLGGVSITSDRLYNAGWTEDARKLIDHLHTEYPQAPLFAVGTSIGANVLVKYLGEEGVNTAVVGAVAICSPWDLLIGDRFIKRRLVQRSYDKALGIGLKVYAQLKVSCSSYIGNVRVPLLCITALDDPVCTREAIPWDECRANKNVVLATTQHGGHLGHVEGITAKSLWWVRATGEFLCALNSSSLIRREKIQNNSPLKSMDEAPYVTAFSNEASGEMQLVKDDKVGDNNNGRMQQERNSMMVPIKNCLSRPSMWVLACVAITTTWPILGSLFFKKKRNSSSMKR